MLIKDIKDEDFVNYKLPSMMIATCKCNWKCCVEQGLDKSICQNSSIAQQKNIEVSADEIFSRYTSNPITKSIVIGGLEPFLQFEEVYQLIKYFRGNGCKDDFVIYTGYYICEIQDKVNRLKEFDNIILKTGRYIEKLNSRYDEVLGITLASNNQYGIKIS